MIPKGYSVQWDKPCPDMAGAMRLTLREWSKDPRLNRINFWQEGRSWLDTAKAAAASHSIVCIGKGGIAKVYGYIEATCMGSRTGVIHLLCACPITPELVSCCKHFLDHDTKDFSLLMAVIPRHFHGVRRLAQALGFRQGQRLPKSALHVSGKVLDAVLYFREAYEATR